MEAIKEMLRDKEAQVRRFAVFRDEEADRLLQEAGENRDKAADARSEADELKRVRIAVYGADEAEQ